MVNLKGEDPYDNMMRNMSYNEALVHNVERVSQLNSTQCDPAVVQMATELSRELNRAKRRTEHRQVVGCMAIVVGIIIVVILFAVKGGRR